MPAKFLIKNIVPLKQQLSLVIFMAFTMFINKAFAQAEVEPWGNITGIRIDGQLMEFETNLSVIKNNGANVKATGQERQRPKYTRNGNQQIITTAIDNFSFTEIVEDTGVGVANVTIQLTSKGNDTITGVFFRLSLPMQYYSIGNIQLDKSKPIKIREAAEPSSKFLKQSASSIQFIAPDHQLKLFFADPTLINIKKPAKGDKAIQVFVPLQMGNLKNGQSVTKKFTIKVSGRIDDKPIDLVLNTAKSGRVFDGLGGNFRLQNPATDPQVIGYCLNNLNVTWGRAEMPWRFWQPAIDSNPIAVAKAGKLNPQVQSAMEMAQRLYKMGMPVILSAWSAPAWAVVGKPKFQPGPDGVWGNPLDQTKTKEIYKSIADYIDYLKEVYGVEISMFSFNESDLGINIRQTGEEHAKLIKELGAYFVSRGLKTKLLLGDNSDATTYQFIYPALNDSATHPYIGAISFHSWRGWGTELLQKWADAATKLNRPLVVGEGSIDAAAWNYPAIFQEQIYALKEINLYTRILAICEPASILQWQLTADYSPLAGGGIFGDTGTLRPIQRFWNLKQLSSTPKGLKAMPIHTTAANISCAAMGDNDKNVYAIHVVNNGASREVHLTGLPQKMKTLRILTTDKTHAMEEGQKITVSNGKARFTLNAAGYTTLLSE
ncbi:MAG: hypothetical protein ABIN67_23845 [Ferruginibacter sp.]